MIATQTDPCPYQISVGTQCNLLHRATTSNEVTFLVCKSQSVQHADNVINSLYVIVRKGTFISIKHSYSHCGYT